MKKLHLNRIWKRIKPVISTLVIVSILTWAYGPVQPARADGIDTVVVALTDAETLNTETRVVVTFTPVTAIASKTIKIYLGDNTAAGHQFTNGGTSLTGDDINCVQDGTVFSDGAYAAPSATVPMYFAATADAAGDTGEVVCTLGDAADDAPWTPDAANGYNVSVVTPDDSGSGIVYVGNGNDVTVSATVLPNLTLSITGGDGTNCVTASGVTACNLGVVLTTAVNSGSYDVDVGGNPTAGITVYLAEDHDLEDATNTYAIDDLAGGDTEVSVGEEEYGVDISDTGSAWTIDDTYLNIDAPVITGPDIVATSGGPVSTSTDNIDVAHEAIVTSATLALTYSHVVTWTATGNF